jgi:hypothetical protein
VTDPNDAHLLSTDEEALLALLPTDGTRVSNPELRRTLGWEKARFFDVRNSLEEKGQARRVQAGQGGSTRRVLVVEPEVITTASETTDDEAAATAQDIEEAIRLESQLYEPIRRVIAEEWSRDHGVKPLAVEITAQQGRRPTGTWSRPDITSVEVRSFVHVPGKFLEVETFELKTYRTVSIQAVYEALAHRRAATRSYVLAYVPASHATALGEVIDEVASVARGHGIGLIIAADAADSETWEEREQAERVEPDPARLDEFIATQLSDRAKKEIIKAK